MVPLECSIELTDTFDWKEQGGKRKGYKYMTFAPRRCQIVPEIYRQVVHENQTCSGDHIWKDPRKFAFLASPSVIHLSAVVLINAMLNIFRVTYLVQYFSSASHVMSDSSARSTMDSELNLELPKTPRLS